MTGSPQEGSTIPSVAFDAPASEGASLSFTELVKEKRSKRRFKLFSFYLGGGISVVFLLYSIYIMCTTIEMIRCVAENQYGYAESCSAAVGEVQRDAATLTVVAKAHADPAGEVENKLDAVPIVPDNISLPTNRKKNDSKVEAVRPFSLHQVIPYLFAFALLAASLGLTTIIALLRYAFYSSDETKADSPTTPLLSAISRSSQRWWL
jgi:hypothetical protein